ncbi:YbaN family protein [Thiohalorhabdus sp.]|uniref:YbaN family protein n=1 Tax=Thiohalorhabdus sp. TaxID=3094134 RepID=UPI002FC318E2
MMGPSMRLLWHLFGWSSVAVGTMGVFLPLLPTTPFMLVAAWAFARSSDRANRWLHEHPRFGPVLNDWWSHRAISRRAKGVAVASLIASLAIAAVAGVPGWALAVQGVVLALVGAYLITRPRAGGS